MTDFDRSDDELISAYLDDEATTKEAALVEARPELMARVDEFRAVQSALGAPLDSTPEGSALDDMIGAALGGFEGQHEAEIHEFPTDRVTEQTSPTVPTAAAAATGSGGSPRSSGVADLQAARQRKHRRSVWLLSAAAAVVLAVAIPAALNNISGGEDSGSEASSADFALETASSAEDEASDAVTANTAQIDRASAEASEAGSDGAGAAMSTQAMSDDAAMEEDDASDADAMSGVDADDTADSASDSAAKSTDGEATAPALAESDEEATQDLDEIAESPGGFFFITADVADLVSALEEPGVLEELEAVSAEFDAPTLECAAEGDVGGLARLTSTDTIVEIVLSSTDQTSPVTIIEQETCAVLTTIER